MSKKVLQIVLLKFKTITPLRSKLFFQVSYDEQGDNEPCLVLLEDLNSLYNKLRRKVTSEEKGKYRSYAEKVKKIPPDFKEKVQTLHDMGYHYDDCEAALRSSDYDLERAVNYLLYMNQNNDDSDSDIGELLSNLLENHVLEGNIEEITQIISRIGQLIQGNT